MAKQNINVGTTANDKKGDSLRTAFQKVNANFTELYTQLGLNDPTLNLGAFEFTGSVLSTTDSTAITIDQATTITSNLTVGGDILPQTANGGDLGSLARPFRSLYVSNSTVFLGGVPLSLEPGTNELRVNNVPISQNISYTDIPNAPVDVSDLTDNDGLLGGGGAADLGDLVIYDGAITTDGVSSIIIAPNGEGYGYVTVPNDTSAVDGAATVIGNSRNGGGGVQIAAYNNTWTFGPDGDLTLPSGGDILNSSGQSVLGGGGGEGLPTVTVPAEDGTTYKGLQVSYGGFHSNGQSSTRNVTKVVIHKPAVTTTTITDTSESDFFQVSGVGTSDVLAMFVVFGDVNGEKPVSDIQAFAEAVIDNVILDDGVEGEYQSVDAMKAAFYDNYPSLASAANGLAVDFQFFIEVLALNGGVTTVREGSGAVFEIEGTGSEYTITPTTAGTNYLPGHKILIAGTSLSQSDTRWDLLLTVSTVNSGGITAVTYELVNPGFYATGTFTSITGTNYNVGSGFTVYSINANTDYVNYNTYGTNYVAGDVITLLGANLTNGTTPENNITITVTRVDGLGQPYEYTSSGTVPRVWRTNNINDGGNDEYDTGNYIDSSYDDRIPYNQGLTVADGADFFGTGSSYSFAYEEGIFGLFVTGNSSTSIGTSGSGPDSGSTIISGNIYGPNTAAQTFDNAVTHINLTNDSYAGPLITFIKLDDTNEVDEVSDGLHIARDNGGGWLYNPQEDDGHGSSTPTGSLWNNDGWNDFTDVESRNYVSLATIWQNRFSSIPGARMVMKDTTTDKYWAVEVLSWGLNGGFSYTRQELDLDGLAAGIRFADGTVQRSAYVPTNVLSTATGNRRIETASGYKQVAVTTRTTNNYTGAISQTTNGYELRVARTTELDAVLVPINNGNASATFTLSFDNVTFREVWLSSVQTTEYWFYYQNDLGQTTPQTEDDPVYLRVSTGGDSVVWWDKDNLPGGSNNFRGAVIDYHAFTDDATIIGTIHIVDDDGEEYITHTEVSSGSNNSMNDNLWIVTSEGEIRYARVDGQAKTLKIHWTAKVFYGSETYD
jgi:hypothetical protein